MYALTFGAVNRLRCAEDYETRVEMTHDEIELNHAMKSLGPAQSGVELHRRWLTALRAGFASIKDNPLTVPASPQAMSIPEAWTTSAVSSINGH